MTFEKPNDFEIKDNVMVDGITEDYVWYHAKLLQESMTHWDLEFQKLVKVMESRHNEHLRMLDRALEENRILQRKLKEQSK
tara:strand:+ start:259 stop:501 length:243 start_codon:yes stop_codon:yes gene_type:complete